MGLLNERTIRKQGGPSYVRHNAIRDRLMSMMSPDESHGDVAFDGFDV
jgi:hypothetical protein